MAELVQRLEEMADVVLFDSPSVLAVTDAVVLASRVDGVVLVVDAGRTRRTATRQAIERLEQVGANVLGGVLNRVSQRGRSYYYPYYARGSGRELAIQQEHSEEVAQHRRWWQRLLAFR